MPIRTPVIVVGCGVSGLTTGILLLESGCNVSIWARDLPEDTTSFVAGALWHPYSVSPEHRVLAWAADSMRVFRELSAEPEAGITLRDGTSDAEENPRPVIEMPRYLRFLLARFESLGGSLEQRALGTLDEAAENASHVVNCSGLGARELVQDESVHGVRGQLVRVEQTGVERYAWHEGEGGELTYVIPRDQDVILGGTHEPEREDLDPDGDAILEILDRCRAIEPALRHAEPLDAPVGLRPCRDLVRLEMTSGPLGVAVVHNYGHGGAGVTLSWGCAREATELALATVA